MAKNKIKKNIVDNDVLTFNPHSVGVTKTAINIAYKQPSFIVTDVHDNEQNDLFSEIKNAIHNLNENKCIEISNKDTGIEMSTLKRKICNIVFSHQRKYIEKQFTTKQTSATIFSVCRKKDKIINEQ